MKKFGSVAIVIAGMLMAPVTVAAQQATAPAATTAPATTTTTTTTTTQTTTLSQAPTEDPNQVICKNGPPPTGSRLGGGRECRTRHEWEQMAKDAHDATVNSQMQGLAGVRTGS